MLTNTRAEEAFAIAERIRKAVEGENFDHGKQTISIGIAERVRRESYKELCNRADKALYHAKNKGRNRVELVDESSV